MSIYNSPYLKWVNMLHPILIKIKIVDFKYFSRKDNQLTRKHITKFTNQYENDIKKFIFKTQVVWLFVNQDWVSLVFYVVTQLY
jgi:hypothetical protein